MLISKFDLYKSEWLELVFDDRNKAYGAYELRQHYGRTMMKAMTLAFFSIIAIALVIGIVIKPVASHIAQQTTSTVVTISNYVRPAVVQPPKPIVHIHKATISPAVTIPAKAFVPFVMKNDPLTTEPPKINDLSGNIGPATVTAPAGPAVISTGPSGPGISEAPDEGNEPHSLNGLQRMPEPYGGAEAWGKFLQQNLKYPDMALDQNMEGRVFVSFIIEKDGHLSNFVISHRLGYGMDEEALRVLKLAPAWQPGMQNGQAVRVKYTLPINFQLGQP